MPVSLTETRTRQRSSPEEDSTGSEEAVTTISPLLVNLTALQKTEISTGGVVSAKILGSLGQKVDYDLTEASQIRHNFDI